MVYVQPPLAKLVAQLRPVSLRYGDEDGKALRTSEVVEVEGGYLAGRNGISALRACGFEVLGLNVVAGFAWHGMILGE